MTPQNSLLALDLNLPSVAVAVFALSIAAINCFSGIASTESTTSSGVVPVSLEDIAIAEIADLRSSLEIRSTSASTADISADLSSSFFEGAVSTSKPSPGTDA